MKWHLCKIVLCPFSGSCTYPHQWWSACYCPVWLSSSSSLAPLMCPTSGWSRFLSATTKKSAASISTSRWALGQKQNKSRLTVYMCPFRKKDSLNVSYNTNTYQLCVVKTQKAPYLEKDGIKVCLGNYILSFFPSVRILSKQTSLCCVYYCKPCMLQNIISKLVCTAPLWIND